MYIRTHSLRLHVPRALKNVYGHVLTIRVSFGITSLPQNVCALRIHFFFTTNPSNPWSLDCAVVLPFQDCIFGITQFMTSSDWPPSLSDMRLRFLPVFSWPNSSFSERRVIFHCLEGVLMHPVTSEGTLFNRTFTVDTVVEDVRIAPAMWQSRLKPE